MTPVNSEAHSYAWEESFLLFVFGSFTGIKNISLGCLNKSHITRVYILINIWLKNLHICKENNLKTKLKKRLFYLCDTSKKKYLGKIMLNFKEENLA